MLATIPALAPERDSLLVFYDVKMSGYAAPSKPPVLDSQDLTSKLTSLWKSRPAVKDRVLVFDGRQATPHAIKLALSASLPSSVPGAPTTDFLIHYAEDQDNVSQLETVHVLVPVEEHAVPTHPRRQNHFYKTGTTTGNVIGIVPRDPDPWSVPVGMVKTLLPRVQDAPQGQDGGPAVVPLAPWGPPRSLYDEILHRFLPAGVLDLTCLTSLLAEACKANGIPYVGCCPSRAHADLLTKRLELLNFEAMATEGTAMFKKELADVLAELGSAQGEERDGEAPESGAGEGAMTKKNKKRGLAKPKATKSQKRQKRAKAAGEEEEEVVDEEEDEGEDAGDDLDDLLGGE